MCTFIDDTHSLPLNESRINLLSAIAESTFSAQAILEESSFGICMSKVLDVKKDAKGRWTPIIGIVNSQSGNTSTTQDPRRVMVSDIADGTKIQDPDDQSKDHASVYHTAPMIDAVQQYINPLCHERKTKTTETEIPLFPARSKSTQDKTWKARVREVAAYELIHNVNDYGGAGIHI